MGLPVFKTFGDHEPEVRTPWRDQSASRPRFQTCRAGEQPVGNANSRRSKESAFGKGERGRVSRDDEMVEHPYVDKRQRLLEFGRQQFVGARLFGDARRVVVRQHDGGCVMPQRALEDRKSTRLNSSHRL